MYYLADAFLPSATEVSTVQTVTLDIPDVLPALRHQASDSQLSRQTFLTQTQGCKTTNTHTLGSHRQRDDG